MSSMIRRVTWKRALRPPGAPSPTKQRAGPNRTPIGTRRFVESTRPQAFVLVRKGGDWRLADDSYVEQTVPPSLRQNT